MYVCTLYKPFILCNNNSTFYHVVTDVYFNQSTYYVNENDEEVQAVLALSNPSSSNVTVEIIVNSITAVGKQIIAFVLCSYILKFLQMLMIMILVHTLLSFPLDQLLFHLVSRLLMMA